MAPSQAPDPAATASLRGVLGALDAALMIGLLAVAVQARWAWADLGIDVDWLWFVESSNHLAQGRAHDYVQFLYTSVPCLIFAGFIELFDDPWRLLKAWAVLGALSAPLAYLAVRRAAGPLAGLAAGWILATQMDNALTVTGIKSPYAITTWSALAMLGLVGATQRRAWGPPLLILGTALTVAHHLGAVMLVPLVLALALVHLVRLPSPRRWLSAGACLLLGGVVLGLVLSLDLSRLLGELGEYQQRFGTDRGSLLQGAASFVALLGGHIPQVHGERIMSGLACTSRSLQLMGITSALGLAALALRLGLRWRARAADASAAPPSDPGLEASWVGLQALLLLGLGATPYLANLAEHDYFESHHVVALVPILLLALAGLARGLAPTRLGAWGALVPAAVLGGWLWWVQGALLAVPTPLDTPVMMEMHSFQNSAALARAMRADAEPRGRQPGLLLWTRRPESFSPWMLPDLANELARLDWDARELPQSCYVALDRSLDRKLGAGRLIPLGEGVPLSLRAFDNCEELTALAPILCGEPRALLWRGEPSHRQVDTTAFLDAILPCVRVNRPPTAP
jgi:hypothetical protein